MSAAKTVREFRAAVVSGIKKKMPSLRACRAYHGEFDAGELARVWAEAPAVLVACLGWPELTHNGGMPVAEVKLGAFILTADPKLELRDERALAIAEDLSVMIQGERWGLDGVGRAARITAENRYNGEIDRKAVAIWLVQWFQKVDLPEVETAALDDFVTFAATLDNVPADETIDASVTVTLEQETP
jgi:hypothetical protein